MSWMNVETKKARTPRKQKKTANYLKPKEY